MDTAPAAALEVENLRSFITAGNAVFTVVSKASGARRTFRVRALPAKPGRADTLWGVSFLNGPENTSDYKYLGTLFPARGGAALGWKLKDGNDPASESAKAFGWLVRALNGAAGTNLGQAEVWHAGRCGRCGRLLTDPESIRTGLGPTCAGRG